MEHVLTKPDSNADLPNAPEGWLSPIDLQKKQGHGKHQYYKQLFLDLAASMEQEEAGSSADFVGYYKSRNGRTGLFASPKAIEILKDQGHILSRPPKGWLCASQLTETHRGKRQTIDQKLKDYQATLIEEQTPKLGAAFAKASTQQKMIGTFMTAAGQKTVFASPRAIKEMERINKLQKKEDILPAPENWSSASDLKDQGFMGKISDIKAKLEKAYQHVTDGLDKREKSWIHKTLIGKYKPRQGSGPITLFASPQMVESLEKEGYLHHKDRIKTAPENWVNPNGLDRQGFIGNAEKLSEKVRMLRESLLEHTNFLNNADDESLQRIQDELISLCKSPRNGATSYFIAPIVVQAMTDNGIISKTEKRGGYTDSDLADKVDKAALYLFDALSQGLTKDYTPQGQETSGPSNIIG